MQTQTGAQWAQSRPQHVVCIWPPCGDVLQHVGCCWLKFENGQIWAKNTQHVATCCNRVAKRTQHIAPNNVAICCVGMLLSFGRGFTLSINRYRNQFKGERAVADEQQSCICGQNIFHLFCLIQFSHDYGRAAWQVIVVLICHRSELKRTIYRYLPYPRSTTGTTTS